MDRQGWIAVILCIVGLVAWQYFYVRTLPPPAPQPVEAVAVSEPTPTPTPVPDAVVSVGPTISARSESLWTKDAEYIFSNDAGGIERAVLLMHLGEQQQAVFLGGDRMVPMGAIGFQPGEIAGGFGMSVDSQTGNVLFQKKEADGLVITKRFIPPSDDAKNPYLVKMSLEFRNDGTGPLSRSGYFVSTGGAAPIHSHDLPMYTKFDWMHDEKMTSIDVNWFNASGIPFLGVQWKGAESLYSEQKPEVKWTGVTSQYFCTILTTEKTPGVAVWATRFDTKKENNSPVYGIQGALGMPGFTLDPGQTVSESFSIYAGPKQLGLLEKMGGGQDAALNFGMFGFISKFLLWAMNSLYGILGSYALAIIVLTLLIKSSLWPIQNKATNEMRKMSALSPKMTAMREKYKDDPQKLNEEMMKMYREYGVNPFSGCFPMLIQIPIFFGFYAMLGSAIQLRNSQFFWIHDLSQPDTLTHMLGFPINLLPIIMAGTMIWQMLITPKSGDAMQQRMFYFMPVVFLVFCYNYASALALYWTTQNLFSIVQLYLTRHRPLPELEKKSVAARKRPRK